MGRANSLVHVVNRVITNTVIYASFAFVTWNFRNIRLAYPLYASFALATVLYLRHAIIAIDKESRIQKLGGHAPLRLSYTPFGIGVVVSAIRTAMANRSLEWWTELFERHGSKANPYTVEAVAFGLDFIFTADEENIKAILATQFTDYGKGPQFRKEWKDFLGYNQWHSSRALLRTQFIKDRVSDLNTFEKHTQVLVRQLGGNKPGETVKADDLFHRFTLDAVTDFLLGRSVDSLQNPRTELADAFTEVLRMQNLIASAGPVNFLVPRKTFFAGLKVINEFVSTYIDKALSFSPEELQKKSKWDDGYTLLHALASFTRDRNVLRDQIVSVLVAGRDTTSATLSWLTYELSRHPQVVDRIRSEIQSFVGSERAPTYADLKSMRYLQHTLNEVLRLYPVLPVIPRIALQDTTLPRGGGPGGDEHIGVLKDTVIDYSPLMLHRREDIYPPVSSGFPHHLEFAPERWDHWTPKSWTYVPFNGGPRICIGQQFALTEMAYTVVRILQTYSRIECRTDKFPGLKSDIVLKPVHDIEVAFWKDDEQ